MLSSSRSPRRVALITVLIASPLLLPILLPSLFNTPDPADPSNYMESFVTATGRTMHGRGSSHASSSRAAGKAPAVPQKWVSKASGSKKKRLKTTTDVVEPESLTYYESDSNPDSELELLQAGGQ